MMAAADAAVAVGITDAALSKQPPLAASVEGRRPSSIVERPSRLASYVLFGHCLGLMGSSSSSLAAAAAAGRRVDGGVDGSSGALPALPPCGAFPPPVVSPGREDNNGRARDSFGDGGGNFVDDKNTTQYVAPHPFFNWLLPSDFDNDNNSSGGADGNNNNPNRSTVGCHHMSECADSDKRCSSIIIPRTECMAIMGTMINFANSIIGAGVMGLGGAFAASGGMVSVLALAGFALLTKMSLNLIVT
jgi:hypothetical protein